MCPQGDFLKEHLQQLLKITEKWKYSSTEEWINCRMGTLSSERTTDVATQMNKKNTH